jgi:hypothetical protein
MRLILKETILHKAELNVTAQQFLIYREKYDHLCGLVVRIPDYRSRGPVSIPGATRFSEKYRVWNNVHSAS